MNRIARRITSTVALGALALAIGAEASGAPSGPRLEPALPLGQDAIETSSTTRKISRMARPS